MFKVIGSEPGYQDLLSQVGTTSTPLQTTQSPLPRLFYTPQDVKSNVLKKFKAQTQFCLHLDVKSDTLAEIKKLLDELPFSNDLRISYTSDEGFIIRWTPGGAYHSASREFIMLVDRVFSKFLQYPQMSNILFRCRGGHQIATYNKEWKQPDECFYPPGAESPSVVLEVGASEHLSELQSDAKWWLSSEKFKVKLVILIAITLPPFDSPNALPKIIVQHWGMVEHERTKKPEPMAIYSDEWTESVPKQGDYHLPVEAFIPDDNLRTQFDIPSYVSPPKEVMEALRGGIIEAWLADVAAKAKTRASQII